MIDFSRMLGDSFEYTREALWDRWNRWAILIISIIIFPLMLGYLTQIFRGARPAPEPQNWEKLFVDGIRLCIVVLIYLIPILIVSFVLLGGTTGLLISSLRSGNILAVFGSMAGLLISILVALTFTFIIELVAAIGIVRFSRMDDFSEALNFSAILNHIEKIGIFPYVIAWVIPFILVSVMNSVLLPIPLLGWMLWVILLPGIMIFLSRYITLIYDSAPA
jgi:hypothetical protein